MMIVVTAVTVQPNYGFCITRGYQKYAFGDGGFINTPHLHCQRRSVQLTNARSAKTILLQVWFSKLKKSDLENRFCYNFEVCMLN